ncbi:hypothetical protein BCV70DRAFT_203021 [Testicularia cyperi]|uniref:Uncharacterized protein n=1 Tax=Testicularia cyperi TaxID=1882483 RepID=A0A317XFS0_9BASI|nr:hypothetical protein BCV70DRAFT_203021 [Testicularia cyperi]
MQPSTFFDSAPKLNLLSTDSCLASYLQSWHLTCRDERLRSTGLDSCISEVLYFRRTAVIAEEPGHLHVLLRKARNAHTSDLTRLGRLVPLRSPVLAHASGLYDSPSCLRPLPPGASVIRRSLVRPDQRGGVLTVLMRSATLHVSRAADAARLQAPRPCSFAVSN